MDSASSICFLQSSHHIHFDAIIEPKPVLKHLLLKTINQIPQLPHLHHTSLSNQFLPFHKLTPNFLDLYLNKLSITFHIVLGLK